ncbi:hypothetical protein JW707_02050 [Candidatus Woesearchaeota archaeon]|nr:hypothetical protein [Candidatus Woesearchaeota archaeon]
MDMGKVNALAKSLKEKHLAANMEEAVEKAKEILGFKGGEDPAEDLKTVDELFSEEKKSEECAEEIKEDLEELKEDLEKAEKEEEKEEETIEKIEEEAETSKEDLEEIEEDFEEGIEE